jgi:site-specific recombinase XerD
MDRVYVFYESGGIRVPFFDFDADLYQRLRSLGIGMWDKAGRQYILNIPRQPVSASAAAADGILKHVFCDRPYVEVGKNPECPLRVNGFFDAPWSGPDAGFPAPAPRKADSAGFSDVPRLTASAVRVPIDAGRSLGGTVRTADKAGILDDARCLEEALALPDRFSDLWRKNLETELRSRKYSPKTIRSYIHYNRALCRTLQKPPESIDTEDIKRYLAYLDKERDLSTSSMNLAISAFKFFYGGVLKKNIAGEQHRPHQDKRLPAVLAKSEIKILLDCEKNPKHRLLLMLTYSSGLRVSEVVALKREHIDLNRKTVLIHLGKGRKDRYTMLSDRAAAFIRDYCALYAIDTWLFPGQGASRHLSVRSAQNIFDKAVVKAEMQRPGLSIHSLRHTFATHLMENGTDIKYIQELLGHASLRTTERYTHVARRDVLRIQSPLDNLSPDV